MSHMEKFVYVQPFSALRGSPNNEVTIVMSGQNISQCVNSPHLEKNCKTFSRLQIGCLYIKRTSCMSGHFWSFNFVSFIQDSRVSNHFNIISLIQKSRVSNLFNFILSYKTRKSVIFSRSSLWYKTRESVIFSTAFFI